MAALKESRAAKHRMEARLRRTVFKRIPALFVALAACLAGARAGRVWIARSLVGALKPVGFTG